MTKPRIFIGSSTEGLEVANAVQQNLDRFAEVTVWSQANFELSSPIITSLVKSLDNFDFSIFIFSPDDNTNLRGDTVTTVRDNVIFETGLFAGKLGIERVFFLKPRNLNNLHLPTDLLGVIAGEYDPLRMDKNLVAATGAFCNQVIQQISKLKFTVKEFPQIDTHNIVISKKIHGKLENDIKMISVYCIKNHWTMISFQKLKEIVHPKFTEDYVMKLVEKYPLLLRRCKLRDGVYGIELLN